MGQLRVNGRHLERDSQPFFWLADTIWTAFTNPTDDEWIEYLDQRASQGFNVLQINALPQWDRSGVPFDRYPYATEDHGKTFDFSCPVPEFWEHARWQLSEAVKRGFVPAIVVMWCNYVPNTWASNINPANIIPGELVEPVVRQICESFNEFDPIYVVSGDTDACMFDTGAYASSGTYFSGNASLNAAKDLLRKTLEEAALQLEVPVEKLSVEYPGYVVAEDGRKLSYYEISHTATSGTGRGQLVGTGSFTTPNFAVPYGAHFAEVAVNVRTGEIKVRKFYALQDAGTPINPELALCQMYGAVLKSIGHTLYEDMVLDKDGKCLTTTFTDYGVPMIQDAPDDMKAVLIDVNDDYGPFGAKSISEIACNGAAPAIAMAIADATGVWVRSWPITGEKILKALGKF